MNLVVINYVTLLIYRVRDVQSGRQMEVYTDQPGLQFYTANFLDGIIGKSGHAYGVHSAFCMETQNYPNAINNVRKTARISSLSARCHHYTVICK